MKTLLLVDGNALVHRAYHAIPEFRTKNGIATNAVYGFITMLLKTREEFKPSHIIVCFDTPAQTFRKKLYKDYQVQRPEMEDSLKHQFPIIKEFLESASITHTEKPGFEADDVIGTLSKKAQQEYKILILTGDRDIIQLVDDKTSVITPKKGLTDAILFDEKRTIEAFGVVPSKIPEIKGLMGDPSDNYKGVVGIGPKTAASLIQQFGSVDNLYASIDKVTNPKIKALLLKHKKHALLSKKLATIVRSLDLSVDIERSRFPGYNEKLKEFLKKMEFNSLLKRYFNVVENKESSKKRNVKKNNEDQLGLF